MSAQRATLAHDAVSAPDRDTERRLDRLRWWNVVVGLVLLLVVVNLPALFDGSFYGKNLERPEQVPQFGHQLGHR